MKKVRTDPVARFPEEYKKVCEYFEAYKEMFGAEDVERTSRDTLSSADRLGIQYYATRYGR